MKDFVAIDFETANGKRSSICSVGAVVVKNGEIVDSFYSLVKPTPNYYAWFCQEVHGLGSRPPTRIYSVPSAIVSYTLLLGSILECTWST